MKRLACVTGAAGGIGHATAAELCRRGWRVGSSDVGAATDESPFHRFVRVDVADEAGIERLFGAVEAEGTALDALVNNAAVQVAKPLAETSTEDWDRTMAVNVRAAFLAVRRGHDLLAHAGGAVVNVSSVHAVATSRNIAAYAASKGALLALTRALAVELAEAGIRVNALLPGAVDTPMLRAGLARGHVVGDDAEARLDALAAGTPLGRVGKAGELARAVAFLCDAEASSYMTGQSLIVDGGATARLSTE